MANIPDSQAAQTWRAGARAITRGWKVFLLSRDDHEGKIPFHNCENCNPRTGTSHDRELCTCLLCHGFYAATGSSARFRQMLIEKPDGYLAIRTGSASRLLVVDAEAHGEAEDPSGLEVLEQWEAWTDGTAGSLPPTLSARSVSGGLHLYYRLPMNINPPSRTRILPGIDIKSAGGYVGAVGSRAGKRAWVDTGASVVDIPDQFIAWYLQRRGRGGGLGGAGGPRPAGYDYRAFLLHCPDGYRDYFFNDLIFRCRVEGKSRGVADGIAFGARQRCAQPPDARWYMPWEHVEYKLERIWNEIKDPKVTMSFERMQSLARSWAGQRQVNDAGMFSGSEIIKSRSGRVSRVKMPRRTR